MNKKIRKPESHPLTWRLKKNNSPIWINEYKLKNGYSALKKSLCKMSPVEIIDEIKKSELKGRGGAGFNTGMKWDMVSKSKISKTKYLVCNADEMEPGTFKDRLLMESIPHQLIEGMIIAAFALQVHCAYIFLRGEYIQALKNLKKSIFEAYKMGYLGKNILKTGFSLNIFIHTGAGRYICGEETALLNSLEGKRANPRFKPPFPVEIGLWGKPTCINNVETLSNVPGIISNGHIWYKNLSKSVDSGTKMMGFSGNVNTPGIWELPFGTTAREILEDYANGMKKGFQLKAWQPGGAGTDFLTPQHIDVPMDFENVSKIGSRLGTAVAMAVDNHINMVKLVYNIEKFFSRESCGWCTPCRDGLPWIVKILKSLSKKKGKEGDIELLEELSLSLSFGKTFCAHAPGAMEPLTSAIKYFRIEFERGIKLK
ncbi:NADH-quinone oxidoreductase subunit NuoF [Buchnera aphidicola (Mindarus keteleerifoliae)]|uniref:NADH-quinone oxidoreductase subunit NuoF n=1 Tax=Buchnera aphidicola TaxID=9 RepID=UPI0031B71ADF